jgi:hypothetical protein
MMIMPNSSLDRRSLVKARTRGTVLVLRGSNPWRVFALPEFKILRPIVVPDAVEVADVLSRKQEASESLFHDKSMFQDVSSSSRSANPRRMAGDIHLDVALAGADTSSMPVRGVLHCSRRRGLGRVPATVTDGDVGLDEVVTQGVDVHAELSSEAGDRVGLVVKAGQFLNGHGEGFTGLRSTGRVAVSPESIIVSAAPPAGHDSLFAVGNRTKHITPRMAIIA